VNENPELCYEALSLPIGLPVRVSGRVRLRRAEPGRYVAETVPLTRGKAEHVEAISVGVRRARSPSGEWFALVRWRDHDDGAEKLALPEQVSIPVLTRGSLARIVTMRRDTDAHSTSWIAVDFELRTLRADRISVPLDADHSFERRRLHTSIRHIYLGHRYAFEGVSLGALIDETGKPADDLLGHECPRCGARRGETCEAENVCVERVSLSLE